jgi:hypothetical protein
VTSDKRIALKTDGDLKEVAQAVCEDKEPRILEQDGEPVAAVVTIEDLKRIRYFSPSPEDIQRSLGAAGAWKGLVADDLAEQL